MNKRNNYLRISPFVWTLLIYLFFVGCGKNVDRQREVYLDQSAIDSSIRPQDDFYTHANGKWLKTAEIPNDQIATGSFMDLRLNNQKKLLTLIAKAADSANQNRTPEEKLIGAFYLSGMDTAAMDQKGFSPIKKELERIDRLQTIDQLIDYISASDKEGYGYYSLISYGVDPDLKNSSKNLFLIGQGGLLLPSKDYYLSEKNKEIKDAYLQYITSVFRLVGLSDAQKSAEQTLQLETKLASSHLKPEELRIPEKNYHKVKMAELNRITRGALPWEKIFSNMGISIDSLNVAHPAYYALLATSLRSVPLSIWKNKIKLDLIAGCAPYLSKDFRTAHFDFFSKRLSGIQTPQERSKLLATLIDRRLDEVVGKAYVKNYFPESAKKKMDDLINNLFIACEKRIKNLVWMSDTTKEKALRKLHTIAKKIGYPDAWKKDYSDIQASSADFFGNILQSNKHEFRELTMKIDKPVDRNEWNMTAATVNAYYNPSNNEIVFPAGILQFPFFDEHADDAINYGAIGVVIGHEITHGFDDEGSQYDELGNLNNWWTTVDRSKFMEKAQQVVAQYNNYIVPGSGAVNGQLTLGENIADIGGIAIAYEAFQMTEQAKKSNKIDGFTPNERFFYSLARIWKQKLRPESRKMRLLVDPHSPEKFRVNGPLSIFEEFYKTFDVSAKDSMYLAPEKRVSIW